MTKEQGKDNAKGDDSKTAKQDANESSESDHKAVPDINTLLEFVAWLIWQKQVQAREGTLESRASAWMKGRGGFLSEELSTVRDASIRLQVSLSCTLDFLP